LQTEGIAENRAITKRIQKLKTGLSQSDEWNTDLMQTEWRSWILASLSQNKQVNTELMQTI